MKKAAVNTAAFLIFLLFKERSRKYPLQSGSPSGNGAELDSSFANSDCKPEFSSRVDNDNTYYRHFDSSCYPSSFEGKLHMDNGRIAASYQPNFAGPIPHQMHAPVHLPSPRSKPP